MTSRSRPLSADQAADTLEVIEDRAGLRSIILTSQLPISNWHEALGEPTIADAVMDRVQQNLHRIELAGESLRKQRPDDPSEPTEAIAPRAGRLRNDGHDGHIAPIGDESELCVAPQGAERAAADQDTGVRPGKTHSRYIRQWRTAMANCPLENTEEVTFRG